MQNEANEQETLFGWAAMQSHKYPGLRLMFHIPNGGSRNKLEAYNLKKQGVKAGVPDICLPVPSGAYHGLYIELKYGKNKTSPEQRAWLAALSAVGYKTAVCYGWSEAAETILKYLKEGKTHETEKD